ncbi:PIN domain-containing protein [Rossellomorea marisflavi]|uniref:PIN domain-containing protein n=1 Tax=Rossellomorea marisflavi TaxID=189381 RepID=UPI003D2EAEFE
MDYGKIHNFKMGFKKTEVDFEETPALIMDTNLLLYLVYKDNYADFLRQLDTLICNGFLILLIPDQVLLEFNRNLENSLKRKKEDIKRRIREAKSLTDYFVNVTEDKGDGFSHLITELENKEEKIFLRNLYRKVNCVDYLVNKKSIKITTPDSIKVVAANMALEKKAPFFGDKGNSGNKEYNRLSFGDAIIFLSACNFLKENKYKETIFLTENYQDFCDAGKKHSLHKNISPLANEVSMMYEINIAKVLNKIIADLPTSTNVEGVIIYDDLTVEKVENEVISKCNFCHSPDAQIVEYLKVGIYGLTWHERCTTCSAELDTGEHYEE